jgi:glycosyltransferase involved in cell wall biosynthesis
LIKTTITIPAYNEIRYIKRTLDSVVGQADEVIISDNASTDGTSDICQSYASRYSEIKYFRQKENIGQIKNAFFCIEKTSGKYILPFCGHHAISSGTVDEMIRIIDGNDTVSAAVPKYSLFLNDDLTVHFYNPHEKCDEDCRSDSPFKRVWAIFDNVDALNYGLYRTDHYKEMCAQFYPYAISDFGQYAFFAARGKIILCNTVLFLFSPTNRHDLKRKYASLYKDSYFNSGSYHPYFYNFQIALDYFFEAKRLHNMSGAPRDFANNSLDKMVEHIHHTMYGITNTVFKNYSFNDLPPLGPEREALIPDLIKSLEKFQKKHNAGIDENSVYQVKKTETGFIVQIKNDTGKKPTLGLFLAIIKIMLGSLKYLCPYGIIRYLQIRVGNI